MERGNQRRSVLGFRGIYMGMTEKDFKDLFCEINGPEWTDFLGYEPKRKKK